MPPKTTVPSTTPSKTPRSPSKPRKDSAAPEVTARCPSGIRKDRAGCPRVQGAAHRLRPRVHA
jgi:hypothetical protein